MVLLDFRCKESWRDSALAAAAALPLLSMSSQCELCDCCIECGPRSSRSHSQSAECCLAWQEKGISRIKIWVRRKQDTETSMPDGEPSGASCVQKSDDSRFCNSHCLSHFAAFFIVMGTKISIVENLVFVIELSYAPLN